MAAASSSAMARGLRLEHAGELHRGRGGQVAQLAPRRDLQDRLVLDAEASPGSPGRSLRPVGPSIPSTLRAGVYTMSIRASPARCMPNDLEVSVGGPMTENRLTVTMDEHPARAPGGGHHRARGGRDRQRRQREPSARGRRGRGDPREGRSVDPGGVQPHRRHAGGHGGDDRRRPPQGQAGDPRRRVRGWARGTRTRSSPRPCAPPWPSPTAAA